MIIFESIRYYFSIVGFLKPNLSERFHWFPVHIFQRIVVYLSSFFFVIIPLIGSMLFEAESFKDIAYLFPTTAVALLWIGLFSILLLIKSHIMELINDLNEVINQSEWCCKVEILIYLHAPQNRLLVINFLGAGTASILIYGQTSHKLEKQTNKFSFIMFRICCPLYSIPVIIWSLYSFNASRMSTDAFLLIFPGT